jgi:hypothetical protein
MIGWCQAIDKAFIILSFQDSSNSYLIGLCSVREIRAIRRSIKRRSPPQHLAISKVICIFAK